MKKQKEQITSVLFVWRTGWDSNPRAGLNTDKLISRNVLFKQNHRFIALINYLVLMFWHLETENYYKQKIGNESVSV